MDIVFVILHYQARVDTEECIGSIIDLIDTDSYRIIIVDNCSPDNSYKELSIKYKNNNNIKLIHNDANLGFAKGNNVGIKYALEEFAPRFIVTMNNDTCLLQTHLFKDLCAAEDKFRFAVLGPMIITVDGRCNINPFSSAALSREMTIKLIRQYMRKSFIYMHSLDRIVYGFFCRGLNIGLRIFKRFPRKPVKYDWGEYKPKKNCVLHGSFLVFSKTYFQKFDGFDPRTFLYMEEEILYTHIINNGLSLLYYPGIAIYHKEDASTNSIVRNEKEKRILFVNEYLKSAKVYLTVLNEYEEQKKIPGEKVRE